MEKIKKYLTEKLHLTWRHYWYFAFLVYLVQFYNLVVPDLNNYFILYTFYTAVGFFTFYVLLRLIYIIFTDVIGRRIFFELVILLGIFGISGYIIGFNHYGESLKIFLLLVSPIALYIAAPLGLILTFVLFDIREKLNHLKYRVWLLILIVLCEFIFCISAGYAVHDYLNPPQVFTSVPSTGFLEDVGKRSVVNLPEVEVLRQKYGDQRLFIKALDRHLIGHEAEWHTDHAAMMEHDALLYSVRPDWDPKITGCVIVVYAAGEGYVYQEDKNLQVIGTETLAQFFKKTEKVPPEMMYRFYLSLH